jgi:hypothetical protein
VGYATCPGVCRRCPARWRCAPGEELVISAHGYGAVALALRHYAARARAQVIEAVYAVGAAAAAMTPACAAACSARTQLVVIDPDHRTGRCRHPWSPRQRRRRRVPGRPVGAGRGARARPAPTTDIAALGAGHWTGNLPKRASTPPRQRDLAEPARRPGDTGRAQRAASRPLRPVVQLPGHVRLSRLAGGPGGLAHWEGTGRLAGRSPAGRPGRRRPQAGGPRTRALRWSGSRPFPRRRCG